MLRGCSAKAILLIASRVDWWLLALVLSPSSGSHIRSRHMRIWFAAATGDGLFRRLEAFFHSFSLKVAEKQ